MTYIAIALVEIAVIAIVIALTHRTPQPSAEQLMGDETVLRMR